MQSIAQNSSAKINNLPYLLLNTCTLYMHIPVHIIITKYILTSPSLSLSLSPKLLRYKTMQTAVRSTFITQVKYDGR